MHEYLKVSELKNCLEFAFDEYYDNPELNFLNVFHLNKKKSYVNLKDSLISTINETISRENGNLIADALLHIKYEINNDKFEDDESFRTALYEKFSNPLILENVRSYVEENYSLTLDEDNRIIAENKRSKGIPESLQFTDAHGKVLLSVSMFTKIIIPLLCEHMYHNAIKDVKSTIIYVFAPAFELFSTEYDIINKLHESVYSKVIQTKYSDRKMWNFLLYVGVTIESVINEITTKLISDILPKYNFTQSPISLNHVAIERNRDYAFQVNYKLTYIADNFTSDVNFQGFTKHEHAETIYSKKIESYIDEIKKTFNIHIEDDLVTQTAHHNIITGFQKSMVLSFFNNWFKNKKIFDSCSITQYTTLLLIMCEQLNGMDLSTLAHILMAVFSPKTSKINFSQRSRDKLVINHRLFKDNLDSIGNMMDEKEYVSMVFDTLNPLFHFDCFNQSTGELIPVSFDVLVDELMRLHKTFYDNSVAS